MTGYSWEMVRKMEEVCRALKQPITFPVRAALLPQSYAQLHWLLQQSDRYARAQVWLGECSCSQRGIEIRSCHYYFRWENTPPRELLECRSLVLTLS